MFPDNQTEDFCIFVFLNFILLLKKMFYFLISDIWQKKKLFWKGFFFPAVIFTILCVQSEQIKRITSHLEEIVKNKTRTVQIRDQRRLEKCFELFLSFCV